MQTTEATSVTVAPARFGRTRIDPRFARFLVIVNGGVPAALLALDAAQHTLGVNAANYAIRTTGILGLLFLVASLAITPLRRLTGWNEIILSRRALGLYAFFYLSVHFAIFFVFDRDASVGSTVHEIVTRRYLQIGTAGLTLMVPLAVTSTDAMIARLGARRWKLLHRLAYVSAIAGSIHYLLLVKADLRKPLAFAGALGVLLAFRAVGYGLDRQRKLRARSSAAKKLAVAASTPAELIAEARKVKARFWSGTLKVARVFQETPDVRTFRLVAEGGKALPFTHEPGQYLNVLLTIGGKRVRRSYTIASPGTRAGYCEVTIKRKDEGYASRHFHDELREGSTVSVSAPAGRFVFTGAEAEAVVLLAAGVGITPLMAIVRHLTDICWAGTIYFVVAARREQDIIFRDELTYLSRRFPNLRVVITLSNEEGSSWTGARGRISESLLRELVPDLAKLPIYVCGPDSMMSATRAMLLAMNVPDGSILTEAFVSPLAQTEGAAPIEPSLVDSDDDDAPPPPSRTVRLYTLGLQKRGASIAMTGDQTVLEAAEEAGHDLPFECRSGVCGQCKVKLLRGNVTMDAQDALTADDRARGIILACQARPTEDLALDA